MNNLFEYQNITQLINNPNVTKEDINRILELMAEANLIESNKTKLKEVEIKNKKDEVELLNDRLLKEKEMEYRYLEQNRDIIEEEKYQKIIQRRRQLLLHMVNYAGLDENTLDKFIVEFGSPKVSEVRTITYNKEAYYLDKFLSYANQEDIDFLNNDKDIFIPLLDNFYNNKDKIVVLMNYGYVPLINDVYMRIKDPYIDQIKLEYDDLVKIDKVLARLKDELIIDDQRVDRSLKGVEYSIGICDELREKENDLKTKKKRYNESYINLFPYININDVNKKIIQIDEEIKMENCDEIEKRFFNVNLEKDRIKKQLNNNVRSRNDVIESVQELEKRLVIVLKEL